MSGKESLTPKEKKKTICHRYFDASRCFWNQETDKPIQEQIKFCRKERCPHGSVTVKTLSNGETTLFVSCDLTWNPISWKSTSEEEAKEMEKWSV